ncbi:TetR/AcrR family transcriptional regulator [Amycolatopsis sp. NBC_00345]
MARWEPNARERLEAAALALYSERGYEQTTVAEIASSAGLTERAFFRHYADKREVLFATSGEFQELFVRVVAEAAESAAPIDALGAGLAAISEMLAPQRDFVRARHAVIMANAELRERPDQARRERGRARRHPASARCRGAGREPGRRGGGRRLQSRLRALDRRRRGTRIVVAAAGIPGRTQGCDRGRCRSRFSLAVKDSLPTLKVGKESLTATARGIRLGPAGAGR